jgi:PIN domain nuclease of toxin-antitoxin system
MTRHLLDTHVLVRWVDGGTKLSRGQKRLFSRPPREPFLVSDASLWEIALLTQRGRLRLSIPLGDWLERATAAPLVERVRITPAIASEMLMLPASFHGDPIDRLLVSTARVLGATLVTSDEAVVAAALCRTLS